MACLFSNNIIRLWEIQTNVEQKKGKKDAVLVKELWNGVATMLRGRQVCVARRDQKYLVGVLGQRDSDKDVLFCALVGVGQDGVFKDLDIWETELPGPGGSLVEDTLSLSVLWQSSDGTVLKCRCCGF